MTKNSDKPLVVGLAGFGTVGGGLVRLLDENADLIRRRCGRDIVLKKVLVRNATKAAAPSCPPERNLPPITARLPMILKSTCWWN